MTCAESPKWIQAYADGELDLERSLDIEGHLASCDTCASRYETLLALRGGVRDPALRYAMPGGLAERIAGVVAAAEGTTARPIASPTAPQTRLTRWGGLRMFATGFAVCALFSLVLWHAPQLHPPVTSATAVTDQEILDSHLRSLELNHLEDVISTDQHTVKPWFDGKISFSPPVQDFARDGYPLIGGRLDYLGAQPAAVLVYRFRKHIINVYVTASTSNLPGIIAPSTSHGYHLERWHGTDMDFAAISDVNIDALSRFVAIFRAQG